MDEMTQEKAREVSELARTDPVRFLRHYMGEELEDYQAETVESVWANQRTSWRSCHDTGKSFTASRLVPTFLLAFPWSIVLTTAPTGRQMKEILWREVNAAYQRSKYPIGGSIKTTSLDIAPDWFALGLSTDEPDKFQGYHAKDILIIVDEAPGVAEQIFEAVEGSMTSYGARLLKLGNPTSTGGSFYRDFKTPDVAKLHTSCFDTPNFKRNHITSVEDLRDEKKVSEATIYAPHLITPSWARSRLLEWGENSPMFQARVLGEFPEEGDDTLIPLRDVELAAAKGADLRANKSEWARITSQPAVWGVDPARFGSDKTALAPRYSDEETRHIGDLTAYHTQRPGEERGREVETKTPGAELAGRIKRERGYKEPVNLEVSGVGASAFDILTDDGEPNIFDIDPARSAAEVEQFVNARSEMWWNAGDLIRQGAVTIPDDEELKAQLSNVKYKYTRRGIQVEAKEEMKKRTGHSPDKADAVVLSLIGRKVGSYRERAQTDRESDRHSGGTITGGLMDKDF